MRHSSKSSPRSWRAIVRWPVFLLANFALLFVIGVSTVRETYRGWTVDREIRALEAHAASLEGRKTQLDTLAKELVSAERIEFEARVRLGRKLPGERVIVLQGVSTTSSWAGHTVDDRSIQDVTAITSMTNPERWWRYFFHE